VVFVVELTGSGRGGAPDLYERKCKHFKDNPTREYFRLKSLDSD